MHYDDVIEATKVEYNIITNGLQQFEQIKSIESIHYVMYQLYLSSAHYRHYLYSTEQQRPKYCHGFYLVLAEDEYALS